MNNVSPLLLTVYERGQNIRFESRAHGVGERWRRSCIHDVSTLWGVHQVLPRASIKLFTLLLCVSILTLKPPSCHQCLSRPWLMLSRIRNVPPDGAPVNVGGGWLDGFLLISNSRRWFRKPPWDWICPICCSCIFCLFLVYIPVWNQWRGVSRSNTALLTFSGRRPAFNFQCLKPQSSVDDQLPTPGTYRGNTSPSRARLQVNNGVHTLTKCATSLIGSHLVSRSFCLALAPVQPGLPPQQRLLDVIRLLGKHDRSWLHSCSGTNQPLGTQGKAHLHPHDPGGWSHRHQPAAVERRHRQPPCRRPSRLVPRSEQNLHQCEDATGQPGLHKQRECGQSGWVGEW